MNFSTLSNTSRKNIKRDVFDTNLYIDEPKKALRYLNRHLASHGQAGKMLLDEEDLKVYIEFLKKEIIKVKTVWSLTEFNK